MKFVYLWFLVLLLSCGKSKTVLLPEIKHSEITKIDDISPAYLFYNEKMPDSIELNRKNLIGTTNWLFNVDRRLTLKQAIPKIIFLQEKKRNMKMHRNENAKNYYTCHDLSINNLGFIEFTNVHYLKNHKSIDTLDLNNLYLIVEDINNITLITSEDTGIMSLTKTNIKEVLKDILKGEDFQHYLYLSFNSKISFQDYITLKYILSNLGIENLILMKDEEIFNW